MIYNDFSQMDAKWEKYSPNTHIPAEVEHSWLCLFVSVSRWPERAGEAKEPGSVVWGALTLRQLTGIKFQPQDLLVGRLNMSLNISESCFLSVKDRTYQDPLMSRFNNFYGGVESVYTYFPLILRFLICYFSVCENFVNYRSTRIEYWLHWIICQPDSAGLWGSAHRAGIGKDLVILFAKTRQEKHHR